MSLLSQPHFHNEEAAIARLEAIVWPQGPYCPQHLKRYVAEFDFRYNERAALGVEDEARADRLVRGIVGKRLLYRDSSAGV